MFMTNGLLLDYGDKIVKLPRTYRLTYPEPKTVSLRMISRRPENDKDGCNAYFVTFEINSNGNVKGVERNVLLPGYFDLSHLEGDDDLTRKRLRDIAEDLLLAEMVGQPYKIEKS